MEPIKLEDLKLRPQAIRVLKELGITTCDALLERTADSLLDIPEFKWATLARLRKELAKRGKRLKGDR